jgi:hypothetical protein
MKRAGSTVFFEERCMFSLSMPAAAVILAGVLVMGGLRSESPQDAPASQPTPATIADAAFISGTWQGKAGRAEVEEHWRPAKGKVMLGLSHTTGGDRTLMFEFLRIEERKAGLYYVAQPGGAPPTPFRATKIAKDDITFENPEHDHPKLIRYHKRADGKLVAHIEGEEGGRRISEDFELNRAQ